MKIIVDTNIIFSSLLNSNSHLCDVLLDEELDLNVPKFFYIELFKHKEKIFRYSKHNEEEILEILYKLLKNIKLFDENLITSTSLKQGYELVKDVDEKDILFVALTIELGGHLWTNDKKLVNGLLKKGFDQLAHLKDNKLLPYKEVFPDH
ncbi:MAG: PIN domain-containing protein [bacterium]|nr:PIN domain-containing protein [bacterium]